MKKIFSFTMLAMICSFASFALSPITGSTGSCVGAYGYLTDSLNPGGSWSSSNTGIATVNASGDVYGVAAGTATITYTLGGSFVTSNYTVSTAPAPITGTSSLCAGTTVTAYDATPGGTWSTGFSSAATIDPVTGIVSGVSGGTVYIYYSVGNGCYISSMDTVNETVAGGLTSPSSVCVGATINIDDSVTGFLGGISGTWSSSNTSIAIVAATSGTSGVVTGVSVGTATITFTVTGICGTAYATRNINVVNTVSPGIISGASSVNIGATITLNETVGGGTWGSVTPSEATVNSSGVVTGVSAGTAVITYAVAGCSGTVIAGDTITVTPINGISGHVNFTSGTHYGNVKVWLITYNPGTADLESYDSVSVSSTGTSAYYQFQGVPTDSYRVKAAVIDTSGSAGYIPTYHTSSFYWFSANVISHTAGAADMNEDINMATGTVTSGPGFIGGSVAAGANRGTATGIPVAGMNMYLINSSTNQPVQSARTDINGDYSFSNLPIGTYYVFPDSLNYMTTAFTNINITSGAATVSGANFTQHTLSKTITPSTTAVNNISTMASSMIAFPNPTNGKLSIQWNESAAENGNMIVTDITGREVYHTTLNMNAGTGTKQIDLSGLVNGLYLISIKSGTLNYNTKMQVQK